MITPTTITAPVLGRATGSGALGVTSPTTITAPVVAARPVQEHAA